MPERVFVGQCPNYSKYAIYSVKAFCSPDSKFAIIMPTFRSYLDQNGVDVVEAWFNDRRTTKRARAKFRNKLRILSRQDRLEWRRPIYDTLGEECAGLSEIRIDAEVPWRPLGFFENENAFTLLICASKDEHGWIPRNACAIGLRRKIEILADPARSHDLPIAF